MIPEAAVEAAAIAQFNNNGPFVWSDMEPEVKAVLLDDMRLALEAAAPHMLSHEREETRLAHVDAVVNAGEVDRLERELAAARGKSFGTSRKLGISSDIEVPIVRGVKPEVTVVTPRTDG